MCDCIKKFEDRVVEEQPLTGMKIIKCQVTSAALFFGGGVKMTGEFEATIEGRKRPVKKAIVYSHCPMCGEEYKE